MSSNGIGRIDPEDLSHRLVLSPGQLGDVPGAVVGDRELRRPVESRHHNTRNERTRRVDGLIRAAGCQHRDRDEESGNRS